MNRLPECLVIVDPNKEKNAVREARCLGITTCALIDTDCDPDDVDLPIPGNDDGIRSIETILAHIADAVVAGAKNLKAKNEGADSGSEKGDKPAEAKAAPPAAEAKETKEPVAAAATPAADAGSGESEAKA